MKRILLWQPSLFVTCVPLCRSDTQQLQTHSQPNQRWTNSSQQPGTAFQLTDLHIISKLWAPQRQLCWLSPKNMCAIKEIDVQGRVWDGPDYFSLREALVWFGSKWNQRSVSTAWHRLSCACQGHYGQVLHRKIDLWWEGFGSLLLQGSGLHHW